MIGFYNRSVILTYISLVSSVIGIAFAMEERFLISLLCILISGCCDMFDGRIARKMTGRTDDEKSFGIQIDSLCDLICFTVLPAIIAYNLGGNKILAVASGAALILCGVIRLGFFNVMAINEANTNSNGEHIYHGLPVTATALIVPFLFIFRNLFGELFPLFFSLGLLVVSLLYILNFTIVKPGKRGLIILGLLGTVLGAAAVITNI